jgi:hypothetical protein
LADGEGRVNYRGAEIPEGKKERKSKFGAVLKIGVDTGKAML